MKRYNYIYLITNLVNNKIYVGKHHTDNLDDGYMGSGKIIKLAITKYGIENFTKEYLAFCDTEEKLNWLEKFYIKKYKAREVGYNLTEGGDGVIGYNHTEENKIKIGKGGRGRVKSEAERKKLSESKRGEKNPMFKDGHRSKFIEHPKKEKHYKWTEERRKNWIPWNKGLKGCISDETRKKMSESAKNRKTHKK